MRGIQNYSIITGHNAEQLLGLDIHLFRAYSEGQISHGDWENFTQMQGDHELS